MYTHTRTRAISFSAKLITAPTFGTILVQFVEDKLCPTFPHWSAVECGTMDDDDKADDADPNFRLRRGVDSVKGGKVSTMRCSTGNERKYSARFRLT